MINIIVISDIKIYCEGLSRILSAIDSVRVVGSVNNREAALTRINTHSPHVVLLDMTMAASCTLARDIAAISPDTKIVALAVAYNESNILQCAEAGITGYVPREASIDELIDAVVGAAKGECYCPPRIAACILKKVQHLALSAGRKCLTSVSDLPRSVDVYQSPGSCLTRRERQIASLLSDGLSNKQIARDLCIEVSTVKNHVHNLLVKLEVKSRVQVVSLLQHTPPGTVSGSMDLDLNPSS